MLPPLFRLSAGDALTPSALSTMILDQLVTLVCISQRSKLFLFTLVQMIQPFCILLLCFRGIQGDYRHSKDLIASSKDDISAREKYEYRAKERK